MALARMQPNPRLPARKPWNRCVKESRISYAHDAKTSFGAFVGFVHPYSDVRAVPGQGRSGVKGRRRSPLLCNDEVVKCCILNLGSELQESLQYLQTFGNINCQADRGISGAPFAFGTTAIWTHTQATEMTETMQNTIRSIADLQNRYYTAGEWKEIQTHLRKIGNYANLEVTKFNDSFECAARGRFVFNGLVLGDTYMHLALRASAISSACVLLHNGLDPTLTNSLGEAPPDLLEHVFETMLNKLRRIKELKIRFSSHYLPELKSTELEELEAESSLVDDWHCFHNFCSELSVHFQQKSLQITTFEHQIWRSKLEGVRTDSKAIEIINSKTRVISYLNIARVMAARSVAELRPGFEQKICIPSDIRDELETLSKLSFVESDRELDTWLRKLEIAAVFVQAQWRGYRVRKCIEMTLDCKVRFPLVIASRSR